MHPKGAKKKRLAQAMFSKEGPNLIKPDVTSKPKVIPKMYRAKSKNNNGIPRLKIETPKSGIANKAAGTKPTRVLMIAVIVNAVIISFILIGAIKRFVKFLLHISSRNIIL